MIGQENLRHHISSMIENKTFPRFSIIVGQKGGGKKLLATEIKEMFNQHNISGDYIYSYRTADVKIDTVRDIISQAYKTVATAIYIIPDADSMSNAAKNAILKVTEEPPNNAYIIMTLEDENNTLDTIKSRATIFHLDRYTPDEIYQYAKEYTNYTLHDDEWDIIKDICDTPGDVNIIGKYPREFYDYVELVVDNISQVSLANAFKIPSKVALKEDAEGYDLKLFWKAFIKIVLERAKDSEDISRYSEWALITSKYLQKLKVTGINKQMLIDNWVLEIYNG